MSGELQCHNVSHICSFTCSVFPTLFHPNPLHPKHLPGLISMQTGYCVFLSIANQMETSWVCFLTSCLWVLTTFQSRPYALKAAISEVPTILVHRILTAVQWGWWCHSYFTSDPGCFLLVFDHAAPIVWTPFFLHSLCFSSCELQLWHHLPKAALDHLALGDGYFLLLVQFSHIYLISLSQ